METLPSESENAVKAPRFSIYDWVRRQASDYPDTTGTKAAAGAAAAACLWLILCELGLPNILGIGRLGWIPAALLIGALTGLTPLRRFLFWAAFSAAAFLLVIAFTPIMQGPADRLIRRDPIPASADAIVVLSAGVTSDGMLPQQGLDRMIKGVELARRGIAPRIVLTRERKKVHGRWVTTLVDQNRMTAFAGIPVMATGFSASTREEAALVKALATRERWSSIVLVTSAFHSRRACETFEKVGLSVSCVPADSRDIAVHGLSGADDRTRAFAMWSYELAGTVRYALAGWI